MSIGVSKSGSRPANVWPSRERKALGEGWTGSLRCSRSLPVPLSQNLICRPLVTVMMVLPSEESPTCARQPAAGGFPGGRAPLRATDRRSGRCASAFLPSASAVRAQYPSPLAWRRVAFRPARDGTACRPLSPATVSVGRCSGGGGPEGKASACSLRAEAEERFFIPILRASATKRTPIFPPLSQFSLQRARALGYCSTGGGHARR